MKLLDLYVITFWTVLEFLCSGETMAGRILLTRDSTDGASVDENLTGDTIDVVSGASVLPDLSGPQTSSSGLPSSGTSEALEFTSPSPKNHEATETTTGKNADTQGDCNDVQSADTSLRSKTQIVKGKDEMTVKQPTNDSTAGRQHASDDSMECQWSGGEDDARDGVMTSLETQTGGDYTDKDFLLNLAGITSCRPGENRTYLHILGLFDMDGEYTGGRGGLNAVILAMEQLRILSASDGDLLPGYCLHFHPRNSKCDAGQGVELLYSSLYNASLAPSLVYGSMCSHVSEAVARALTIRKIPQFSFASMAASLSNKTQFPYFSRLAIPESKVNIARVKVFQQFNWTRIAIIYQLHDLFFSMVEDLDKRLDNATYDVRKEPFIADADIAKAVRRLKEADMRIIVGAFYESKARKVMCEAYRQQLVAPKVVWVVSGILEQYWWRQNDSSIRCTPEEMDAATIGHLSFSSVYFNPECHVKTEADITPAQFRSLFRNRTRGQTLPYEHRAPPAFDGLWAIAKGVNLTLQNISSVCPGKRLEQLAGGDECLATLMTLSILQMKFQGVAGPIGFDEKGEPTCLLEVKQYNGQSYVVLGHYDADKSEGLEHIKWRGGGLPPRDRKREIWVKISVDKSAYVSTCVAAVLGILLAIAFLVFNIVCRKHRIIKMSSPNFNNLILVGCILAYGNVFIVSMQTDASEHVCTIFFMRVTTLLLGFSLVFGSLFVKTWRVYSIHRASYRLSTKTLQDKGLAAIVGALAVTNSLLVLIWRYVQTANPAILQNISQTPAEDGVVYEQMYTCATQGQYYFVAVLLVIQGLVCIIGSFLAWETRNVQIRWLNDSRQIALCIYNVVVVGVVGVVVALATETQVTLGYSLTGVLLILATTATQCLIFVPKVASYVRGDKDACVTSPCWHTSGGLRATDSVTSFSSLSSGLDRQPSPPAALDSSVSRVHAGASGPLI